MPSRRSVLRGLAALPVAAAPVIAAAIDARDPIIPAIERHRIAQAAWATLGDDCEDEEPDAISDAESAAREALHATVPQTLAGLAAYVAYWAEFVRVENAGQDDPPLHDHVTPGEPFPAIAQAMAALFPAG